MKKQNYLLFLFLFLIIICLVVVPLFFYKREPFENPSFEKDIKPLFRNSDVAIMKKLGLDLSNYEDVSNNAEKIYQRLADKSMPCDGGWSDENIQMFQNWLNQKQM